MFRVLVASVLIFAASSARAEEASATVTTLVRFANEACDFLRANWPDPPQPLPTAETLAPHFGRVLATTSHFERKRVTLALPRFRAWRVTFEDRAFELTPPRGIRLTVADFEKILGAAQAADVDMAARAAAGDGFVEPQRLDFPRSQDRGTCALRVTADGHTRDRSKQRVLSFSFDD